MPIDPDNFPPVEFTIFCEGEQHRVRANRNEYRDLRELIVDQFNLDTFGQCGGNGRCATCMVQIDGAAGQLSCQVSVDDDLANVTVQIPDNY